MSFKKIGICNRLSLSIYKSRENIIDVLICYMLFVLFQCVFEHENVYVEVKKKRMFNSSFWVERDVRVGELRPSTCGWEILRLLQQSHPHQDHLLYKH